MISAKLKLWFLISAESRCILIYAQIEIEIDEFNSLSLYALNK